MHMQISYTCANHGGDPNYKRSQRLLPQGGEILKETPKHQNKHRSLQNGGWAGVQPTPPIPRPHPQASRIHLFAHSGVCAPFDFFDMFDFL
jgi:hypothetical protein